VLVLDAVCAGALAAIEPTRRSIPSSATVTAATVMVEPLCRISTSTPLLAYEHRQEAGALSIVDAAAGADRQHQNELRTWHLSRQPGKAPNFRGAFKVFVVAALIYLRP